MKIGSVLIIVGVLLLVIGYAVPLQIASTSSVSTSIWAMSGTIKESSSSISSGQSITLTITVSYYKNTDTTKNSVLYWNVNGNDVNAISIGGTGTWSYTYTPTYGNYHWNATYMSYLESGSIGGRIGSVQQVEYASFGGESFSVAASAPVINSFSGSPNPSTTGQNVAFSSSINWNGNTGSITYSVNGNSVGSDYTFNQPGSYTVTLTAVNAIGSTSKSYTQVVQSSVSKPSIESISANPNPAIAGTTVDFSSVVNWNGNTGTIVYEINGHQISGTSYTFNSAGNYTITVVSTNSAGSTSSSIKEVVNNPAIVVTVPTINSFSSSPNPVKVGVSTTFITNVSWNGNVGTISYKINGQNISGNSFVFSKNGNYTAEVIATNSAGSASANLTLEVEPLPIGNIQNVGKFAISYNGTNAFYVSNSQTYTIHATSYPYIVSIYYVEDHGETTNLSSISIQVGSTTYVIPFTNITTVMGYTAYEITLPLSAGSFTITGYLTPENTQINGGAPIQTTNFIVNTETPIHSPPKVLNYTVLGIGGLFIIFGVVFLIKRW